MSCQSNYKQCTSYIESGIDGAAGFCSVDCAYHCTESLKHNLPIISHTTAGNLAHCNMSVYYSLICGISPRDEMLPEAVKMGKAWDKFLDDVASGCDVSACHYSSGLNDDNKAKFLAITNAFADLAIHIERDGETQPERFVHLSNGILTTHADRIYKHYMVESKFTSRPENYLTIPNIAHQVGSYFLAHPDLDRVVMEVAQVPQQKLGKTEELGAYANRIYDDIMARPGCYFRGYKAFNNTFGKTFYRSEFDLDELKRSYERQLDELRWRIDNNVWYEHASRFYCDSPSRCWYKTICDTGCVSEDLYYIKGKSHKRKESLKDG